MDEIINLNIYDINDFIQINMCRIYLQVLSLADISEGDGHRIMEHTMVGRRDETWISRWHWTNIP